MKRVKVGDVLELQRRPVRIDPESEYGLVGVYSFGKGIFHRTPQLGIELGDYKFSSVQPGDLVLSNIQAWEGAIAFATETDRNTVGTQRFLSYTARDPDVIDTNWARYYFLSPAGFPHIQKAAPGSVTRNRTLSRSRFEAIEMDLPGIDEQRKIASYLDRVSRLTDSTSRRVAESPPQLYAFAEAAIQSVLETGLRAGWTRTALGSVAEINPRRAKVDPEDEVAFVPMRALDDVTGRITGAETKSADEAGKGYKQFRRGDVIFARITPCMQNGKSAVISKDLPNVGFGSTEFHVIRPGESVLAEWVHAIVRTRDFKLAAAERFTGTAGQQRVPASFLEDVQIPLPPTKEAQLQALEHIGRISTCALELRRLSKHRVALTSAVLPSALNRAFAGLA